MEEALGSKCELKIWRERSAKGGNRETVSIPSLKEPGTSTDGHYAIVVRQVLSDKNYLEKTSLTINSAHILRAFREVIKSHPTVSANFSEPFEMTSPFQMLYHYWDELVERKDVAEDDDERMHLGLLLEVMEHEMGQERRAMIQGTQSGKVQYDSLWTIFRPGDTVVTHVRGHVWLLQLIKTAYEENKTIGKYLEVQCQFTDFDGKDFGHSTEIILIRQKKHCAAELPANILDLPVYPRKFLREGETLEERLAERGDKFLSMCRIATMHCEDVAEHLREQPPDFWDPDMDSFPFIWETHAENGRVIVDRGTFRKEHYQPPVFVRPIASRLDRALCPPFVYGYSLAEQGWCRFFLPTLRAIDWDVNAFDSLILPQAKKRLVRALVKSHAFPAGEPGTTETKGKGLVILLHGAPGSGKTLTAECAAEATQRPLLSISTHSLNKYERPYLFEWELRDVLRFATIWNAVVLFDEADVFLEARSEQTGGNESASRNALVAIFLRHLEYFAGIVFLTTNRIGVFDAAMKSRVHLALGYDTPEPKSRRQIWSQCLRKIPKEEVGVDIEEASEALSQQPVNGREISNIVGTARTLARDEQTPLDQTHVDSVLEVWHDFLSALHTMRESSMSIGRGPVNQVGAHPIRRGSILTEEPESF